MWSTNAYKDPDLRDAFEQRMTTLYEKAEAKSTKVSCNLHAQVAHLKEQAAAQPTDFR